MSSNCILIIEDDPLLGPLVVKILIACGFQVVHASTGDEALNLWRETGQAVSVALVDLNLPGGINGEKLARQLKSDKPSLKLILMSGGLLPQIGSDEAPRDFAFLSKPFSSAELVALVRDALEKEFA